MAVDVNTSDLCGLIKIMRKEAEGHRQAPERSPVPLISVNVNAAVVHAVAQVEVTQVYMNQEENPIETIYYFPVNPEGAVTHFEAEVEGVKIKKACPTTIAPRYVSPSETDKDAAEIRTMTFSNESSAPLTLKVAVSLQGKIKSIESPTHKVKVEKTGAIAEKASWEKAIVELDGKATDMDRDFVLNIVPEEIHRARLYTEEMQDGSTAMMVHLIPSFRLKEQQIEAIFVLDRSGSMMGESIGLARNALSVFLHSLPANCYFNVVGFGSTHEFLFPVSVMYDDESLKVALAHAQNVEADLGGTEIYEPLREIYTKPGVQGYLRQLFVLTDGQVSNTDAVLGIVQTNAHKARVFSLGIGAGTSHYLIEGIAKAGGGTSAFVSSNESFTQKVLNQLKNGLQPSLTDVQIEWDVAQTCKVTDTKEVPLVKEKTLLGYNKPIEPGAACTETVSVSFKKQSPARVPCIFDGSQLLVFGMFMRMIPKAVTIKANSPDGPLTVKLVNGTDNDIGSSGMIHKLAGIKLVRELEQEILALGYRSGYGALETEHLKQQVIEIGCKFGIASNLTSFVAVDVTENKPCENLIMLSRHIASQVYLSHTEEIDFENLRTEDFRKLLKKRKYAKWVKLVKILS